MYMVAMDGSVTCMDRNDSPPPIPAMPPEPARKPNPKRRRGAKGSPGKPVTADKAGKFVLTPATAKTTGGLRYNAQRNNLGSWMNPKGFCQWRLKGVKAGKYSVEFAYGSTNPGVVYTIIAGDQKLQGKTAGAAIELVENALKLERAGASVIVFEVIPEEVARAATEMLSIPTIGIGAGRHTDGQVLIVSDMLGINAFELRHNKKYDDFHSRSVDAFRRYAEEVTAGRFPGKENVRPMKTKEFEEFNEWKSAMK